MYIKKKKTLNDCSLGTSVSFVSLESQCFPQPELGTQIFVYLINSDKTLIRCRIGLN